MAMISSLDIENQPQSSTNNNTSTQKTLSNIYGSFSHWRQSIRSRKEAAQDTPHYVLVALFLFARYYPPISLSIFFTGKVEYWMKDVSRSGSNYDVEGRPSSIYKGKRRRTGLVRAKIQGVSVVSATRLGIFIIFWLIINLSVPHLRKAHLLGSPLWKWSFLAGVALLLIPAMLVASFILVAHTPYEDEDDDDYWIRGLEGSIRWVFYFAFILIIWLSYFFFNRSEIKHVLYRRIHTYISLTLVTCLIGAILGLLRNLIVLWWKSKFIYTASNKVRILVVAFRLYLLLLLFGEMSDQPYKIWWILLPYYTHQHELHDDMTLAASHNDARKSNGAPNCFPVEKFMLKMSEALSLYKIHEAANWLTQRFDLSEDVIPTDLDSEFLGRILDQYKETQEITANVLISDTSPLDLKDAEFLLQLQRLDLNKADATKEGHLSISLLELEEWMKVAHRSCFVYINKLHGDLELTKILFKVLVASQVVITFLVWLFITQLATTRLVVALGSLFLGLAFMFGDTCKTLFQGVIFSFVTHPFDVGDRVEINKIKLEVKKINILTTIFQEEGTDKIVLYPNSAISTVNIIKLNTIANSGSRPLQIRE